MLMLQISGAGLHWVYANPMEMHIAYFIRFSANSISEFYDTFYVLSIITRPNNSICLIVSLYKAIVRPHLEHCIHAWRPCRKKYIAKLERIQRRATKMIPELRDLSNESRLLQCGLTTLEAKRLRGDQIEVFKIVNVYEDVDRNMFFKLKEGSRTG